MAQSLGQSEAQTEQAVQAAVPMMLGALGNNAQSAGGASALFEALQRDHGAAGGAGAGPDLGGLLGSLLGGGGGRKPVAWAVWVACWAVCSVALWAAALLRLGCRFRIACGSGWRQHSGPYLWRPARPGLGQSRPGHRLGGPMPATCSRCWHRW
ncbi:DUF937 domain-containing protein [Comamonas sp. JC664]|uniref:DUF937 domain-containing protein n=1 Tax=Comamonas sp. JC664 TaxID=2801917 RepID=UPI0036195669